MDTSLRSLVEANLGMTVQPGPATVALPSDLVALRLVDPARVRQVIIVQRHGRVQSIGKRLRKAPDERH